jgi:hypothetical protein
VIILHALPGRCYAAMTDISSPQDRASKAEHLAAVLELC